MFKKIISWISFHLTLWSCEKRLIKLSLKYGCTAPQLGTAAAIALKECKGMHNIPDTEIPLVDLLDWIEEHPNKIQEVLKIHSEH